VIKKMKNSGFTLVELLVVISIIAFLGAMLIPSIVGLFSSGADSQSYAMLTAELASARTLAIKTSCYVCVHIQQANDPSIAPAINGKFYMAVLIRNAFPIASTDPNGVNYGCYFYQDQVFSIGSMSSYNTGNNSLVLDSTTHATGWVADQWSGYWVRMISGNAIGQTAQIIAGSGDATGNTLMLSGPLGVTPTGGYYMIYKPTNIEPQTLPGTIAFGRLSAPFIVNNNYVVSDAASNPVLGGTSLNPANDLCAQAFTTVNIIFSPAGTVVASTPDGNGSAYLATVVPTIGSSPASPPNLPGYFYDDPSSGAKTKIWPAPYLNTTIDNTNNAGRAIPGTQALTMVDYTKYTRYTGTQRQIYLDVNNGSGVGCPFLSIDVNTGQMLPRR
jgi:prepilin-type N-terminal cleavage/methylation domain-containing protein